MAKKKISGLAIVGVLAAAGLGIWYFTKKKKETTANTQAQSNTLVQPNTGTAPTGRTFKPGESSVASGGQTATAYGKM